eukprot:2152638-Pleurochrysis_carterae.AAC.1
MISAGAHHTLFLSQGGSVLSCGKGSQGAPARPALRRNTWRRCFPMRQRTAPLQPLLAHSLTHSLAHEHSPSRPCQCPAALRREVLFGCEISLPRADARVSPHSRSRSRPTTRPSSR